MTLVLNILLGFVPALILGASIAAGVEDDDRHRKVFLLVYGLWALTLAGWNWLESSHVGWVVMWGSAGIVSLGMWMLRQRR